jgi:hypothetical protein
MPFKLQKTDHANYIQANPSDFVIRTERDMLELITACVENDTQNVILYQDNLSPDFFDLKTQLAGTLFQKLANYHVRGAAIISMGQVKSERFKELILEYNRGQLFRFFEDKEAAEKWLALTPP